MGMDRLAAPAALLLMAAAPPPDKAHPPIPTGSAGEWFGPDAYPADAIRAGEQGRVTARVSVDATGKPSACAIATSSGSFALDSGTCSIVMASMTFRPATDEAGRAVAGVFPLAVRWQLPKDIAAPRVMVTFAGEGDAVTCTALIDGMSRRLRPDPCHSLARAIVANGGRLDQGQMMPVSPEMLETAPR